MSSSPTHQPNATEVCASLDFKPKQEYDDVDAYGPFQGSWQKYFQKECIEQ